MSSYRSCFESSSPENHRYVKVQVWAWIDGLENPELLTAEVFEGEENDTRAIKDALNKRDLDYIEIIN